jgi:hypothetical protein
VRPDVGVTVGKLLTDPITSSLELFHEAVELGASLV